MAKTCELETKNNHSTHQPLCKMIEVYKTNVKRAAQARKLLQLLLQHFPNSEINFDLEDCDKVLRVKGGHFVPEKIMQLINERGFACNPLE